MYIPNLKRNTKTQSVPADFVRFEFALLIVWLVSIIAALISALIIISTVTLLSRLYQAVTTDWLARLCCSVRDTHTHRHKRTHTRRTDNLFNHNCIFLES